MDRVRTHIPYSFLREHSHVTWQSLRFGLQHELVDPVVLTEFALEVLGETDEPSQALLDVASAVRLTAVSAQLDQLAAAAPQRSDAQLRAEWLYLTLAWTYEHRSDWSDPLLRVEEIYADFGYPQQITEFVRYMPMEGPDLGSREENERRLFERWRSYLERAGTSLRASR